MSNAKLGFELRKISVPISDILPVKQIKEPEKTIKRYKAIRNSVKVVGPVEPLVVYPQRGNSGKYFLNDGHLRLFALKELKKESADCIIATDDECFTYNARVSRISPIQEHRMIVKAVRNGVKPETIAEALDLPVRHIIESMSLLKGVDEKAAELIKDKNMSPSTIRLLKKVKPERQVEMVELMLNINNFTPAYAEVLILATPENQLTNPDKPKKKVGLSSEAVAQMEQEMDTLQNDSKTLERDYGSDVLTLTLACGYIKKLLENAKVVRFLNRNYREILTEFESIAATESL